MTSHSDALIIGGGFYGCVIALALSRHLRHVTLVEREPELLTRASLVNQARVHTGYHYPRNLQTAASSGENQLLFAEIFKDCVDDSFTAIYAIARGLSKVTPSYFERFCRQLRLPLKPAADDVRALFAPRLISAVYECREFAFDALALRHFLRDRLAHAGIELCLGHEVAEVEARETGPIRIRLGAGGTERTANRVYNTTYANLGRIGGIDCQGVRLRHQLTEVCLVTPPAPLQGLGVTVMDGPFFSIMPFPAAHCHSFTHVRYTPHVTWAEDGAPAPTPDAVRARAHESRFPWMLADGARYLPILEEIRYKKSLFDIKTTLTDSISDDGRPIAYHRDARNPNLVSILGGKIDNIFDVLNVIESDMVREAV
ncbi:MAG: FAD-binding oxidoreductase [Alphaproteobacteria bacterium]|nr:FAD-binding oxidoreductase [Alphaproteobacteria bacterium]